MSNLHSSNLHKKITDKLLDSAFIKTHDLDPEIIESFIKSNNFIIVGDERYSLIDLADCTIYADDRIIVFDVTDYLPIDSFDIRIETESLQWEDYSHQWMIEVYNYLKTYQDIIIIYND